MLQALHDMLNVIDLLGKTFTAEEDDSFTRTVMEEDEGHGVYSHHVESTNGLWKMNLDTNGVVETIFLQAKPSSSLPFGLEASMTPDDVVSLFGAPDRTGEEKEIEFLGKYGPWLRFDREDMCIHVEFNIGTHSLKQITVMLPEIAP